MYKVIYTKSLDSANDIVAESWEYNDYKDAKALFDERVRKLVNLMLENDILRCKLSTYKNTAFIKIEDEHHCIALKDDQHTWKTHQTTST